jgi:hypothetical protein
LRRKVIELLKMAMIQLWGLPSEEHIAALGEFVALFAINETYLKQLFWKAAGIDHELGQLMSGGASTDDVGNWLRILYDRHCTNQLEVEDIIDILNEISALKVLRNNLAHRPWKSHYANGVEQFVLSNEAVAKSPQSVEQNAYAVDQLNDLCIRSAILGGRILRHLAAREAVPMIEQHYQRLCALPLAPWLDKSTPRVRTSDRSRPSAQKTTRQRRSSRE